MDKTSTSPIATLKNTYKTCSSLKVSATKSGRKQNLSHLNSLTSLKLVPHSYSDVNPQIALYTRLVVVRNLTEKQTFKGDCKRIGEKTGP